MTFAHRVRSLRHAAGLTQAELAEGSGISERTVSDLERGLRSGVYPATARRLATALHVAPESLPAFLAAARGVHGHAVSVAADERARLPLPLTRLLGRESELALLLDLLADAETRLVTLVGPGGIGKTRLAVEAAAGSVERFSAGVYFVDLSGTDDAAMVMPAIASACGVETGTEKIATAMAHRFGSGTALLLLDTFERVTAAAISVSGLVTACPTLTVLTTSRVALHLRGEREIPLQPLPADAAGSPAGSLPPAVELFVERARAVRPDFDVTGADVVTDICASLDGLPLAIELAAARVRHMPVTDLRFNLDRRLDSLVGGPRDLPIRQQTMRGALDWSYALLGPAEMRLFRAASVFRGGFSRDSATELLSATHARDSTTVMPALSSLVDSSLVLMESDHQGLARYRLLDVTREYAVERAAAAGELDALRRMHALHFLALAERAEPELRRSDQSEWHARLLAEEANFRAAMAWANEAGEEELALRLAGALWMFWRWAALFLEGRAWLDAALVAGEGCALEVRCQAMWGAGWLAFHQGDYRRTEELGMQMLRVLGGSDDAVLRRNGLTLVGNAALGENRNEEAVRALSDAVQSVRRLDGTWHLATSLLNLGTALVHVGRPSDAVPLLERALRIYEALGDRHFTARALVQRAHATRQAGAGTDAAAVQRAMAMFAELGDGWAMADGMEAVATLRSESEPGQAVVLAGAADRLRQRISMRPHPSDAAINRSALDRARAQLGDAAFASAWAEGQALPLDDAVAIALEAGPTASPRG